MESLKEEIAKYVESKRHIWSSTTVRSVASKLTTLAWDFHNPSKNYQRLVKEGYGKYTIKIYFTVAAKFEFERFKSQQYGSFLKENSSAFRNCYAEKTRALKREEFNRYAKLYLKDNLPMYNLLTLMGAGGLRLTEAMSAKWEDIQDGFIIVKGKGGKTRKVPFNVNLLLRQFNGSLDIVSPVNYRFYFKRDLKPFTPHDFRAFYATEVANHPELNIKDAAVLLGHSSITTTSRYIRSDLDRIKQVLGRAQIDQQGIYSADG